MLRHAKKDQTIFHVKLTHANYSLDLESCKNRALNRRVGFVFRLRKDDRIPLVYRATDVVEELDRGTFLFTHRGRESAFVR